MQVLKSVNLKGLGKKFQGKVRDFYIVGDQSGDRRVIVTTDRQSAFDYNLGYIPYKGAVLNQLSAFWFHKTKHIIPNHMISVPDPNVMIAKSCEMLPVEMVVRGYISGVTVTSIWGSYKKGERTIYGVKFPDGLRKNKKLPHSIITPTYHGDMSGKGGHDTRLTREEIIKKKLVPEKIYKKMEEASLKLFAYGSKLAKKRGLILVDTKYEFGLYKSKLLLIDEIHTPDSSRFWIAKTYDSRFQKGQEPENFDKEFLRLWYTKRGYKDGLPPPMSKSLINALSKRYIKVFETLTATKFIKDRSASLEKRIRKNLAQAGIF